MLQYYILHFTQMLVLPSMCYHLKRRNILINGCDFIFNYSLTFERTAEIRDSKKWAATFTHLVTGC